MLGRVIDPVIAFDGLPCSKEIKGEIAFQLIDSFLPENSGIYVLRAEDGRIHALKEDVFYDLKCHIEDISGLRLGSVPDPVFSIDAEASPNSSWRSRPLRTRRSRKSEDPSL